MPPQRRDDGHFRILPRLSWQRRRAVRPARVTFRASFSVNTCLPRDSLALGYTNWRIHRKLSNCRISSSVSGAPAEPCAARDSTCPPRYRSASGCAAGLPAPACRRGTSRSPWIRKCLPALARPVGKARRQVPRLRQRAQVRQDVAQFLRGELLPRDPLRANASRMLAL